MEELLRSLGIEPTEDAETIVSKLELKQSEIMERLDNVEDERRRQKLESDLNQIAGAITAFSWMHGKTQTGIAREEDATSEDFSDLKNQHQETKTGQPKSATEAKNEGKSEEQLYDEALAVMGTLDYAKGVEMMRNLAESGYVEAQLQMAKMYDQGNRVQKDEGIAAEWYQKAAEQGNVVAQYNLSVMYGEGRGVPMNDEKAVVWMQKAANQGDADSIFVLGAMYYEGKGVPRDDRKAVELYQKAAELGNPGAQWFLGERYEKGQGVAKNLKKAEEWYRKAAEQGNEDAKRSLHDLQVQRQIRRGDLEAADANTLYREGMTHYYPNNPNGSDEKALEFFQKAAEQGHAEAQYMLGEIYSNNHGVAVNSQKSKEWYLKAAEQYQKAAEQENADADVLVKLGDMYYNGRGVSCDYEKAIEWYQMAADQGDIPARVRLNDYHLNDKAQRQKEARELYNLGKRYEEGLEGVVNYTEVVRCYEKVIELVEHVDDDLGADVHFRLGEMYYYGRGVRKDIVKAAEYYAWGAIRFHPDSCRRMCECWRRHKWKLDIRRSVNGHITTWWMRKTNEGKDWEQVAKVGGANAKLCMGLRYEIQWKLYKEAKRWYQEAAEQGSEEAKRRLQELR